MDNEMFQASALARVLFLVSMRLARMLGCLATLNLVVWTIGHSVASVLASLFLFDRMTLLARRLLAWIFGRSDNWMNARTLQRFDYLGYLVARCSP
jgi:quinol-cytochrome oxidoreductase complex cytochrome b subunit